MIPLFHKIDCPYYHSTSIGAVPYSLLPCKPSEGHACSSPRSCLHSFRRVLRADCRRRVLSERYGHTRIRLKTSIYRSETYSTRTGVFVLLEEDPECVMECNAPIATISRLSFSRFFHKYLPLPRLIKTQGAYGRSQLLYTTGSLKYMVTTSRISPAKPQDVTPIWTSLVVVIARPSHGCNV